MQVGIDPPHRVIVPADPDCLSLLEQLRHGATATAVTARQQRVVADLRAAGLLDDPPALPRRPGVVAVHDHGLGEGSERLRHLLEAGGVEVAASTGAGTTPPDLVIACATGPLPRAVVDPWLAEGTAHLVVAGTGAPGSLRVGPLVEPGLTACLRCVDAAESAGDPRRGLVLEQLAARPAAPVGALTLDLALVWAARDVVIHLAGGTAATWSATVEAHEVSPVVRRWRRQPDCGCCWDELAY